MNVGKVYFDINFFQCQGSESFKIVEEYGFKTIIRWISHELESLPPTKPWTSFLGAPKAFLQEKSLFFSVEKTENPVNSFDYRTTKLKLSHFAHSFPVFNVTSSKTSS